MIPDLENVRERGRKGKKRMMKGRNIPLNTRSGNTSVKKCFRCPNMNMAGLAVGITFRAIKTHRRLEMPHEAKTTFIGKVSKGPDRTGMLQEDVDC